MNEILGVYLRAPHGRLIYDGDKKSIASGKRLPISGPRVVCSKEYGSGWAFGIAHVGPESLVTPEVFDEQFVLHRVPKSARKKWWGDKSHLYLYPILRFEPFDEPIEVDIEAGVQTDMGEVSFRDESVKSTLVTGNEDDRIEDVECHDDTKETESEDEMPWTAADATRHTKEADTPEKKKLWADTANSALERCKEKGGSTEHCEGSAVRQANAVVARQKKKSTQTEIVEFSSPAVSGLVIEKDGKKYVAPVLVEIEDNDKAGDDGSSEIAVCTCPNCKSEFEGDEGTHCSEIDCPDCDSKLQGGESETEKDIDALANDEKVGRRINLSILSKLQTLKDGISKLFTDLSDVVGFGEYADQIDEMAAVAALKSFGIKNHTTDDGKTWFELWPTNAYFDREKEAFTTPSIADFIARNDDKEVKGEAWFWHTPGSKYGTIHAQAVMGDHFAVQLGTYDDTVMGKAFKEFFSRYPDGHPEFAPHGWGTSHGFAYVYEDRMKDGVYNWFETKETSVLPLQWAANPYNPKPEVVLMDDKQRKVFEAIGSEIGMSDFVSYLEGKADKMKEVLDANNVEHKDTKNEQVPVETSNEAKDKSPLDELNLTPEVVQFLVDAVADKQIPPKKEDEEDEEDEEGEDKKPMSKDFDELVKTLQLDELSKVILNLSSEVASLKASHAKVTSTLAQVVDSREKDVAARVAAAPRFSWFEASKAADTVLGDDDELKSAAPRNPTLPNAVEGISAMIAGER